MKIEQYKKLGKLLLLLRLGKLMMAVMEYFNL